MTDNLSKQSRGFRKHQSTQYCLISLSEMWKKVLDQGGYISAIFMYLSNALDTLTHFSPMSHFYTP